MSLLIFTRARIYISLSIVLLVGGFAFAEDWKFDFSRRQKSTGQTAAELGSAEEVKEKGFFSNLFDSSEPVQELVILNTDKGFVPSTVRVRQGGNYKIHLVNINEREKNVSFVLDAFSEHHATFFGKMKTIEINPQKNGIFPFVSPETSAQGRLVVYPPAQPQQDTTPNPTMERQPTSTGR